MNKIEKTTRPFRYDLNQISYDYTVEVMNRFKGLDLVDRVTEELWVEVNSIVEEAVTKTVPKKKKSKWLKSKIKVPANLLGHRLLVVSFRVRRS